MARQGSPRIEFLWWKGCPSWERALAELEEAMREAGLDTDAIEITEVSGEPDAERLQFVGSPTILVDGRDVQPPGDDEPAGLTCRIYRLRDGRVSPLPDPQDLRESLARANSDGS
ncbi:MAG: hypothetical protein WDZ37_01465 [Solirubrobacterales bacterium]